MGGLAIKPIRDDAETQRGNSLGKTIEGGIPNSRENKSKVVSRICME